MYIYKPYLFINMILFDLIMYIRGVRGVLVSVRENGHNNKSSNAGLGSLPYSYHYYSWKKN